MVKLSQATKSITIYGICTGLNRGSVLLFFPILTSFLDLKAFGIWSLCVVIGNLVSPIISLYGTASVIRDGSNNFKAAMSFLRVYFGYTVGISLIFLLPLILNISSHWFFYALLIGFGEALFNLILSLCRAADKSKDYILLTCFKLGFVIGSILIAKHYKFDVYLLLMIQSWAVVLLSTIYFLHLHFKYKKEIWNINFLSSLKFCLSLIPHGLSQWIMSSSDRAIIKTISGAEMVGIYSISYNLALILMLVNSGIGMAIPTIMIRDQENWKKNGFDFRYTSYYTAIVCVLFLAIQIVYLIDKSYFGLIGYYSDTIFFNISIIYAGISFLGFYYFYTNYLFVNGNGMIISKNTVISAIVNLLLTIALVPYWGVYGASVGTLIAYFVYLILSKTACEKIASDVELGLFKKIITIISFIGLTTLGFYALQ